VISLEANRFEMFVLSGVFRLNKLSTLCLRSFFVGFIYEGDGDNESLKHIEQ
jgi:hypothetical protein